MVVQFARIIVGAALQDFGNLLSNERIWAFALAFDSSTHQGTTFFDIRIRQISPVSGKSVHPAQMYLCQIAPEGSLADIADIRP
jgi:hypothetical protein